MNRKFTLIECLITLSIIAVLMSILLPALSKAREKARLNLCQSNLQRIGIAYTVYSYSNDKYYPELKHSGYRYTMGKGTSEVSEEARPLNAYSKTGDFTECPSDKGQPMWENLTNCYRGWGSSYTATSGKNIYSVAYVSGNKPRRINYYSESDKKIVSGDHNLWANRDWANEMSQWHWQGERRRANLLFQDMHVKFYSFPLEYNSFSQDEPPNHDKWGHY